jgi:hypothetical protein
MKQKPKPAHAGSVLNKGEQQLPACCKGQLGHNPADVAAGALEAQLQRAARCRSELELRRLDESQKRHNRFRCRVQVRGQASFMSKQDRSVVAYGTAVKADTWLANQTCSKQNKTSPADDSI